MCVDEEARKTGVRMRTHIDMERLILGNEALDEAGCMQDARTRLTRERARGIQGGPEGIQGVLVVLHSLLQQPGLLVLLMEAMAG